MTITTTEIQTQIIDSINANTPMVDVAENHAIRTFTAFGIDANLHNTMITRLSTITDINDSEDIDLILSVFGLDDTDEETVADSIDSYWAASMILMFMYRFNEFHDTIRKNVLTDLITKMENNSDEIAALISVNIKNYITVFKNYRRMYEYLNNNTSDLIRITNGNSTYITNTDTANNAMNRLAITGFANHVILA